MANIKIYDISNIQQVYWQHAHYCGTVLYSIDGYSWTSVPMDTGKWNTYQWKFAFIETI